MAAHAYIGSFTSEGGHGLTTAAVDQASGALTALTHTAEVENPSYLALSGDAGVLYAVSETEPEGAAAAFSLADPAAPALLGTPVAVGGGAPTHLCVHRGHLFTADYAAPGSVSVLSLTGAPESEGGIGGLRSVLRHEGHGPDAERQEAPHAHMVTPDPSGRWLVSVDLGTDSVRVCELDTGSGELEIERELGLRSGIGPRHLTWHPAGTHGYVMNELDSVVTVCRWDADKGSLRPVAEARVLPAGADGVNYPSELVVSRDGRYAWAANRGHDSIAVLTLDAGGERLELAGTVPCGGTWPRDLVLDPAGTRLYAANQRSGNVAWFDVDPATGMPEQAGSLDAPAASCVLFA